MNDRKKDKTDRKNAWAATKTAVHAYVHNPCAATEVAVHDAVVKVRDLPNPCKPAPVKVGRKSKKRGA